MEQMTSRGVREARRQAMLAKSIVDQFSGPRARLNAFTAESPFVAVAAAFAAGIVAACILRGQK